MPATLLSTFLPESRDRTYRADIRSCDCSLTGSQASTSTFSAVCDFRRKRGKRKYSNVTAEKGRVLVSLLPT
jgi:hypothetical protein